MMRRLAAAAVVLALAGCSDGEEGTGSSGGTGGSAGSGGGCNDPECTEGLAGTRIRMDYSAAAQDFYSRPFPSETRRAPDGRIDLSAFPRGGGAEYLDRLIAMLDADAQGFALTAPVFFAADGALAAEANSPFSRSVESDASVFLVGVDSAAPDYLVRYPIETRFAEDGGPFGAANFLSAKPLQGVPLRPSTTYAAVVLRSLGDAGGEPLGVSPSMVRLARGFQPEGMSDDAFARYQSALEALGEAGVAAEDVAGLAVFETDNPLASFGAVVDAILTNDEPTAVGAFSRTELFDDYCVYEATTEMPVFQTGDPPYLTDGGAWTFDEQERPIAQGTEQARILVTIPRAAMPASGFPTVLFSRTGGGGDRPLVERGVRSVAGEPADIPGTGPALHFARAGFAGVSVDGPHGGMRNVTGGDEQLLVLNVGNPVALRDNVRQSAVELVLQAHLLDRIAIDVSDCPDAVIAGGTDATFDTGKLALMGHSMGATISPLAVAFEPRFGASILSGAGGSWIENIVHKQSPIEIQPIAEAVLGVPDGYSLHEHDPGVALFQWAVEPSDPPVFGGRIVHEPDTGSEPRHVLMLQGIIDTYILPPIANATSLSIGLDLAGDPLDASNAGLGEFDPLEGLLGLVGRSRVPLPVSGNVDGSTTAVVVQHAEGPIEDGHEVVFQTEAPKHQYRCFLESWKSGTPKVPVGGDELDACD